MSSNNESIVVLVKCTNAVERELDFKIFGVYINRLELGQSLIGMIFGLPAFFFLPPPMAMLGPVICIPLTLIGIGVWRMNKPLSYQWDLWHRLGLVRGKERCLPRVSKLTVLVPDAKPCRSSFNGTTFGGLGRTAPCQAVYGVPNWCEIDIEGRPSPRMLATESALGTILIPSWENGDGPAPGYARDCTPNPHLGQTEDDFTDPTIPMHVVMRPMNWKDLS